MTTRQKKLADLAARIDGLVARAAAADRAVIDAAIGRLMGQLRELVPAIDNTRLVQSPIHSHALVIKGRNTSHEDRLSDLAGRLASGGATGEDLAIVAGLDAADLAMMGCTGAVFIASIARMFASF